MLVENQLVEVKWSKKIRKWYESKGYCFTKTGDILKVRAEDLSPGSHKKVKVRCDYCGNETYVVWKDYKNYNYSKYACLHCRQTKTSEMNVEERRTSLYNRAIEYCNEKGYVLLTNKNDIINGNSLVTYRCPKHGTFTTRIYALVLRHGCSDCQHESNAKSRILSPENVFQRIKDSGGELLNKDDYSGWYVRNLKIVCPICQQDYFVTSLYQFLRNPDMACKRCSKVKSAGERKIAQFLEDHNIEFMDEHRFIDCRDINPLPFDFYIPSYNICIEYQGEQHDRPVDYFGGKEAFVIRKKHDNIKATYCNKNNINLATIHYSDFDNLYCILNHIFFPEKIA